MAKPDFGPNASRISTQSLKEATKVASLKPTVHDVAKALGKRVRYRTLPDGKREPHVGYKTNDGNGHLTKEAKIVQDMMNPFWMADTARVANQQGFPGGYGIKGGGKTFLGSGINRPSCDVCGNFMSWCECDAGPGQGNATGKSGPASSQGG